MDDLIQTIRFKELTTAAAREYKQLLNAQLLDIEDIMMFPLEKSVDIGLSQLVNQLHEQTSFIITTNKNHARVGGNVRRRGSCDSVA